MKQICFFKSAKSEFGGELLLNKRKSRRPIDVKKSLHTVLMADISASGSLLKHRHIIEVTFNKYAEKFGIKMYKKAIVSNHIHFIIKTEHRLNYLAFIRAITGVISKTLKVKWKLRPFTRIVEWGRAFKSALSYVLQNDMEARGLIPTKSESIGGTNQMDNRFVAMLSYQPNLANN